MAIKKSELYSSLWSSCDELRGGMDASQYKDYLLILLFIKYVSEKYAGLPFAPITIPAGSSFADMVALKGQTDIGDQINKRIVGPLARANQLSDMPHFNDATKLGSGKEMVDRLTNLIAIFENRALDFSKNRADGDDILGDAYEYLMRHFAAERGKSKGQFYTPAEVSRIMAQILGIRDSKPTANTTVYDPTCGSDSLLLKVADEAGTTVTLYGQEKDAATSGLARMNMILHNNPTALIVQGNTLADPKFREGEALKTFDFVVANPPFSDKRWSTGQPAARSPEVFADGRAGGDREERFQPEPAALHRQPAGRGPAGHRRASQGRHPGRRRGRAGAVPGGLPEAAAGSVPSNRPGYVDLAVDKAAIETAIYEHPEFVAFMTGMNARFDEWRKRAARELRKLTPGFHPKALIATLSEDLLAHYAELPLVDPYDVYRHLMDYWATTMQDDAYLVAADGWKAETHRVIERDKKGKEKDKGWACDLVPKELIFRRYFAREQAGVEELAAKVESVTAQLTELEEEHGGEEGAFAELEAKVNGHLERMGSLWR